MYLALTDELRLLTGTMGDVVLTTYYYYYLLFTESGRLVRYTGSGTGTALVWY